MTPPCWLQQRVSCLPLGFTGLLQETHIMSAPSIACACCVAGQMSLLADSSRILSLVRHGI